MSTVNKTIGDYKPYHFKSHGGIIMETNIVNFGNLVGLHEVYFIDM